MAILSFALTKREFLSGKKTVTRRAWSDRQFQVWVNMWEADRRVHDAWDNIPRAGGRKIGRLVLTAKPYRERLGRMPEADLRAEGGMCSTVEEFCALIGKSPKDYVTVIRFKRI